MLLIPDLESFGINNKGKEDINTTQGFNDLLSHAKKEGFSEVYIPEGFYLINGIGDDPDYPEENGGIKGVSNLKLRLHPRAVFKVKTNDSFGYSLFYIGADVENFSIVGGELIGERYTHVYKIDREDKKTHEWGFGIHIRGAQNITLDNVSIRDFTGDGIIVSSQGMKNVDYGPEYVPARNINILNCEVDGCRRNNIALTSCENVNIKDCGVFNAGVNDVIDPAFGIDIEGYGEGDIDFESPENIFITGCTFLGNRKDAVCAFSGYGVRISGNYSDSPLSYGNGADVTIVNNTLVNENYENTAISGQRVSMGFKGNNVTITGNTIKGFKNGIDVRGADVIVGLNTISETPKDGVAINVYRADNVLLTGNSIQHCDGQPISVFESSNVMFQGGAVYASPKSAVLVQSSRKVSFNRLMVRNCSQAMFIKRSFVSVEDCELDFEELESTQSYAVSFDKDSEVRLSRNKINGSANIAVYGEVGKEVFLDNNYLINCSSTVGVLLVGKGTGRVVLKDNDLKFKRSQNGGYGIILRDLNRARLIRNDVGISEVFRLTNGIDTSQSSTSVLLRNVLWDSTIKSAEDDTLLENIEI